MRPSSSPTGSLTNQKTATSGRGTLVSATYPALIRPLTAPLTVMSFSAGARGCIGSRFAMIESVCILALLVRRFEVLIPADLDKEHVGLEEKKKVLLAWTTGVTLVPTGSRVRLRPREI